MNEAFFTLLTERLTELTGDLRFLHSPSGEMRAPQIVGTELDRPVGKTEEGENCPFVIWAIHGCEFARKSPAPFSVVVDGCIYNEGTIAEGTTDITSLTLALGKIVEKPWYKPYKLSNQPGLRPRAEIGDPEKNSLGRQPQPYFYMRMYLNFVVATGHGG